ncbi:MAG: PRC-barrel domain-containing protein [Halomonas sp.]|uniref:PRC-barrel domain-containing protein n=1 Tax=Halomonas sp. TaxID=1486246 RepID=UPI0019DDDD15|nr:PRC-barrel domain-containing protein [Halomonas sp.]MBE0489321.1 PRC-barrel domain-containing protein [Halomonas sp.]
MKKLTTFILSAAFVPALALSMTVSADKHDTMKADGQQRAHQQGVGEQMMGSQHMKGKPAGAFYADDIIGKNIKQRSTDEEIGEIQDLVIGEDGRIVGVVVKTGTFLGLGGQDVGLSWDQIDHVVEDDESLFYTDVDEDTLRESPEFERD